MDSFRMDRNRSVFPQISTAFSRENGVISIAESIPNESIIGVPFQIHLVN